jgi:hypothetical protein
MTLEQLNSMTYEEFVGWIEYFKRRPVGWREDNRAAVIAMSMAGDKVKPEQLFHSLKTIKEDTSKQQNLLQKFAARFGHRFSERPELLDVTD